MKFKYCAGFAASLAFSGTAMAQDSVNFSVDDQAYEFAIPDGFCEATGEQIVASQYVASLDTMNDTVADVDRCGTFGEEYILIKVQKQRMKMPMTLPAFLGLAQGHFSSQFGQDMMDDEIATASREVDQGTGGAIQLTDNSIRYGGSDDRCVYLHGTSIVEAAGQTITVDFSTCVTLVGGYTLAVHSFRKGSGTMSFDELSARSRMAAEAVTAL